MLSLTEIVLSNDHRMTAWLLAVSVKASLVLVLATAVCRLLRRKSAAVRHRIWAMSLMASLSMPLVVAVTPPLDIVPMPTSPSIEDSRTSPEQPVKSGSITEPSETATIFLSTLPDSPSPAREETEAIIAASGASANSPVASSQSFNEQHPPKAPVWHQLLRIWVAGSCVIAGSLLLMLCLQAWHHRRLHLINDDQWNAALAAQSRRLNLRRAVKTFESNRRAVPAIFGILMPYLVVPQNWRDWSDEQRECILLHELAHIERNDLAIQLVGRLAVVMHWINPLAWYALQQLRVERELACDDRVLMVGQRASEYASQLLQTLKMYRAHRITLGIAMAHSARLDQRILSILDETRSRLPMNRRTLVATLILFAAMTVGLGTLAFYSPVTHLLADERAGDSGSDAPVVAAIFNGRVVDQDGKPMEGAEILVIPMNVSPELRVPVGVRAHTDADGSFHFEALDMTIVDLDGQRTRRRCIVIARAVGYGPDWSTVEGGWRSWNTNNFVPGTNVSLRLVKDDVPLRGRLLDADGMPLAGARVRITALRIPHDDDLDAQLKHEAELRQSPSGLFVGSMGYERSLLGPHLQVIPATEVQTDADGQFKMTGLGNDRIAQLSVSAKQVKDADLTVVTRKMADVTFQTDPNDIDRDMSREITGTIRGAEFQVTLQRGLTVTGQVIDRVTRQPISGMQIGTRRDRLDDLLHGLKDASVSDADGRFTITGLDPKILTFDPEHRDVNAVSQPGGSYGTARGIINADAHVLIECSRGIPFHLKVVDESGHPVDAVVTSIIVTPNHTVNRRFYQTEGTICRADKNTDGSYEGFVLPGPGAILVRTPSSAGYRPAHVDPKGTFAPGRTEWTAQEEISSYGTHDTVMGAGVWYNQHDYSAIVLTNAQPGSNRLNLHATVFKDRPRQLTIVDSEGKPVEGVKTRGLSFHPWDTEPALRSTSLPVVGLHPDRPRRILFFHEDRQLIGFLMASGDGEAPYTVRMQPWGAVTGRILDDSGKPLAHTTLTAATSGIVTNPDPTVGDSVGAKTGADGRFRIERLVPGLKYTARVYPRRGQFLGNAFENLVVEPGEVHDLGDMTSDQLKPDDD